MFSHSPSCTCGLCLGVPRVQFLLNRGSQFTGFIARACIHLREFEGKLRDELSVFERESAGSTPLPPPPVGVLPGLPKVPERRESSTPKERTGGEPVLEGLSGKAKGGAPSPPKKLGAVKEESEAEEKGSLKEVSPTPERSERKEERHKRKEKEPKRRRSKSREKKERKLARKNSPERSSRSHRGTSEAKKKDRREGSRGEEESPRSDRGKEKKYRDEGEDHRERQKEKKDWGDHRREQVHTDFQRSGGASSSKGKGRGWKGHVPFSSHPRWRGTNKGVVKRAKQERFNNRYR